MLSLDLSLFLLLAMAVLAIVYVVGIRPWRRRRAQLRGPTTPGVSGPWDGVERRDPPQQL